jgi:hypothetical protein
VPAFYITQSVMSTWLNDLPLSEPRRFAPQFLMIAEVFVSTSEGVTARADKSLTRSGSHASGKQARHLLQHSDFAVLFTQQQRRQTVPRSSAKNALQ